jgi:acyl-CoA thioesterase-1
MSGTQGDSRRTVRTGGLVLLTLITAALTGCSFGDANATANATATATATEDRATATASASVTAPAPTTPSEAGSTADPLPPGSIPTATGADGRPGAAAPGAPRARVRSYVVVGDSITAGSQPTNSVSAPGPDSWLRFAEGAPLTGRGGWAVPGATTADLRSRVGPVTADVLVVMAGTNDLAREVDWDVSAANLRAIAATVGVGSVLVSAIPPSDAHPDERSMYDVRLAQLAMEQGWGFIDPWTSVDAGGSYLAGSSADGVHPTQAVARTVGQQLRSELLLGVGG